MSVSLSALKMVKKLLHDSLSSPAAFNLMKFFGQTYQILVGQFVNNKNDQENMGFVCEIASVLATTYGDHSKFESLKYLSLSGNLDVLVEWGHEYVKYYGQLFFP